MKDSSRNSSKEQWKILARNDWSEILELSKKKTFRRKFDFIEAFLRFSAERGFHKVTHADIAERCKVTRPLVAYHFPSEEHLIGLSYRYIYARLQKACADAVVSKAGPVAQLQAYVNAIALWVDSQRDDARFLTQFFALLPASKQYRVLQERNLQIGRERITALLLAAQEEGRFAKLSRAELSARALSLQHQVFGYIVIQAGSPVAGSTAEARAELVRSCLKGLGL